MNDTDTAYLARLHLWMERDPSEHMAQTCLVAWAQRTYPDCPIFAIPNGGSRHKAEAARLKAEGVRAGVPDLFLPVARHGFHGLFIELKTATGRPSKEQLEWLDRLATEGYAASLCRGFDAARETIADYLAQ